MNREIYEKIDDVRDSVYQLIDMIRRLPQEQLVDMATYAYVELFPCFDTLAYYGESYDRVRDSAEDRSRRSFETGHGSKLPSGTSDVGSGGLS